MCPSDALRNASHGANGSPEGRDDGQECFIVVLGVAELARTWKWLKAYTKGVIIRIAGATALVLALCVGFSGRACGGADSTCPAYSFGSEVVLRSERVVVVLFLQVVLITLIVRVIWEGRPPDGITQFGVDWKEQKLAEGAGDAIKGLKEELETGLEGSRSAIDQASEAARDSIKELSERLGALEARNRINGDPPPPLPTS